jgi:resuscitation-promoting factor RpfB
MATVFTLVLLAVICVFARAVIKPEWFSKVSKKQWSRGKISAAFGAAILTLLVLIGVTAPPSDTITSKNDNTSKTTVKDSVEAEPAEPEPAITTETVTETQPVAFSKTSINDSSRAQGTSAVTTSGVDGVKTLTFEVTKKDGVETGRVLVSEVITKQPVTEVTSVGTKVAAKPKSTSSNCDPNYTPCVPNVSYDLDCGDIGFTVSVIGNDPHRFDRDNDGYGCE